VDRGFDASLTASASPDMRVDFGISAVLGDCDINLCTTLAGANLAFAEAKGSFDFQITSPFDEPRQWLCRADLERRVSSSPPARSWFSAETSSTSSIGSA